MNIETIAIRILWTNYLKQKLSHIKTPHGTPQWYGVSNHQNQTMYEIVRSLIGFTELEA